MKIIYDKPKIQESIKANAYNERNLTICKCGKHFYPSKLMFIRFLEQFKDVKGTAKIWSIEHWNNGIVEIHVELEYNVGNLLKKKKLRKLENGFKCQTL